MLDPEELSYTENTRVMSKPAAISMVSASIALFAVNAVAKARGSWRQPVRTPVVLAPVGILAVMTASYHIIRNATHEAIRLADADAYLDQQVLASIEEDKAKRLTPGKLLAALGDAG